jgi:electron transport complex protein RnfB
MELTFQVVPGLCVGCGACLRTCPEHAVRPGPPQFPGDSPGFPGAGGRVPAIIVDRCTGCSECMEVCPVDAIEEVRWSL